MTARAAAGVLLLVLADGLGAGDWPQWRGPARDGRLAGFAAREAWPRALAQAWRIQVGTGHASPVVVGDSVYVFTREGEDEVVQSLERATGKRRWRQSYPAPYRMNPAASGHGKGPKATPVVAGGRVCTYGISGVLSCFETASGRLAWRREFGSGYRQTSPLYGVAQSPVVDAGRLIVHVGGPGDGALTALAAANGTSIWSWKGDGPAYASPVVATLGGLRQVVTFSESYLVGIAADTGALLWQLPFTTSYVQNAVTPIVEGDTVFYSGLDHPLRALRVVKRGSGWSTEPVWENADVAAYMSTPVLTGRRLFGLSHRRKGQLFCLDAATGKRLWLSEGRQGDNAALVAGDGVVFALTTDAELLVLRQDGKAFAPLASYRVATTPTWAHLVVLDDGVLVKDAETLALLRF